MIHFDPEQNAIIVDFNEKETTKESGKKRKPSDGSSMTREELSQYRIDKLQYELIFYFQKNRFKALTDLYTIKRKLDMIHYICKCGELKHRCFKKIIENGCSNCKRIIQYTPVTNPEEYTDSETGEKWKETRYKNLWVSSFGNIKHNERLIRTSERSKKGSLYINRRYVSIPRLFYTTFELPNYQLLIDDTTRSGVVVSYKDDNVDNLSIDNLYLRDRGDLGYLNLNNKKMKNV